MILIVVLSYVTPTSLLHFFNVTLCLHGIFVKKKRERNKWNPHITQEKVKKKINGTHLGAFLLADGHRCRPHHTSLLQHHTPRWCDGEACLA